MHSATHCKCNKTMFQDLTSCPSVLSLLRGKQGREKEGPTGKRKHATFICSLCIANHAYVMRPSSFMQIVWVLQQCLIHIHAAGGTWHLSAGRLVTLNLCVNVEHMQRRAGWLCTGRWDAFSKGEAGREMSSNETTRHSHFWFCTIVYINTAHLIIHLNTHYALFAYTLM